MDVLQPLDRRRAVIEQIGDFRPARASRLVNPRPNPVRVALNLLSLTRHLIRLVVLVRVAEFRGRSEDAITQSILDYVQKTAPPLRKIFMEHAYRFDLLPAPMAIALASLDDQVEPPPIEQVVEEVELAIGGTLDEVFAAFDPNPLGARFLRCSYVAELRSGTPVIVNYRPRGARQQLIDQLAALRGILGALELFSFVRPGFFKYLRIEIEDMLMEEADFRRQARSQNIFRKRVKRDRLKSIRAPKQYTRWLTDNILITRLIEGVPLGQVIASVEQGDHQRLAELEAQGIEPRKIARRLLQLMWWEQLENLFFHPNLRPQNIIIQPGGRLQVVHFEDTAVASSRYKRLLGELFDRLDQDDGTGAAEVLVQFLAPLPFIDTHTFSKRVEARLWHQLLSIRNREGPWWERTSAGVWGALLVTSREEGVQVHTDVVQLMRSSMMVEAMAFRLDPTLNLLKEYRRYRRGAERRIVRRWEKDTEDGLRDGLRNKLTVQIAGISSLMQRMMFFAEAAIENFPIANLAMPRKAAYVASVVLSLSSFAIAAAVVGTVGLLISAKIQGATVALATAVWVVVMHPVYLGLLALLVFIGWRRLMFRLGDTDPQDG